MTSGFDVLVADDLRTGSRLCDNFFQTQVKSTFFFFSFRCLVTVRKIVTILERTVEFR